jgi:uncharacterized surface anchored protein
MEGIPGAKVILRLDSSQQTSPDEEHVAISDASGYYQFEDIASGSYSVQIRAPRGYRAADDTPVNVVVTVHQTEELDIQLYPGAILYLPVVLRP